MKQTRNEVIKRLLELQRAKHERLYLSYVNDFLTVSCWAEYWGLNEEQSRYILGMFQEAA